MVLMHLLARLLQQCRKGLCLHQVNELFLSCFYKAIKNVYVVDGWWVESYDISAFVTYLMPDPVYIYIYIYIYICVCVCVCVCDL